MPNVNVTYADMQSAARQLKAGEQTIEGDLARLKHLVDNLVAGGYVTDASSRLPGVLRRVRTGATKTIQGLTGMGQYLDAAAGRSRHRRPAGRRAQVAIVADLRIEDAAGSCRPATRRPQPGPPGCSRSPGTPPARVGGMAVQLTLTVVSPVARPPRRRR